MSTPPVNQTQPAQSVTEPIVKIKKQSSSSASPLVPRPTILSTPSVNKDVNYCQTQPAQSVTEPIKKKKQSSGSGYWVRGDQQPSPNTPNTRASKNYLFEKIIYNTEQVAANYSEAKTESESDSENS